MYLDSNFFIFAKFDSGLKGQRARVIVDEIAKGKKAVTSVLALDEVILVLRKNGQGEVMREFIEEIYSMKNVEVKEVASQIPLRAMEFIEKYHLKPRDAFHCASMAEYTEQEIVSDDGDFDKMTMVKRIKI